jgi:hypothetical protein
MYSSFPPYALKNPLMIEQSEIGIEIMGAIISNQTGGFRPTPDRGSQSHPI